MILHSGIYIFGTKLKAGYELNKTLTVCLRWVVISSDFQDTHICGDCFTGGFVSFYYNFIEDLCV
jgi:hypothetical protein